MCTAPNLMKFSDILSIIKNPDEIKTARRNRQLLRTLRVNMLSSSKLVNRQVVQRTQHSIFSSLPLARLQDGGKTEPWDFRGFHFPFNQQNNGSTGYRTAACPTTASRIVSVRYAIRNAAGSVSGILCRNPGCARTALMRRNIIHF